MTVEEALVVLCRNHLRDWEDPDIRLWTIQTGPPLCSWDQPARYNEAWSAVRDHVLQLRAARPRP